MPLMPIRQHVAFPAAAFLVWLVCMLAPHVVVVSVGIRCVALLELAVFSFQRRSLTPWIFWSMLAGVELGVDLPRVAVASHVFSDIFLRLIKCIVAPLIFGTLVTGIAGHSHADGASGKEQQIDGEQNSKSIGRLSWKSLVYFEVLTTIALVIGLLAIHISRAGVGISAQAISNVAASSATATVPEATTWQSFLLHVFPDNIAKAVADGQILEVAVFALLFGLALNRVSAAKRAPMLRVVESLTETMFAFTNLVMYFAPIGVGAALAYTVATAGFGVMANLGSLLLTLYAALIAFALFAMLPAALIARVPLRGFLGAVAEPASIAFATSTSEAALPRAMEAMEAFGVPRRITGFVIPAGYSFNLAGSALYLAVAAIFVAQASGMHMGWRAQIGMLLVLMLTSKGVAGVPRAVLVVLLATASTFHLPEGPIFLILGVDALMDMGRTTINVTGNCLAAAVIARWEGVFGEQIASSVTQKALSAELPL
jgi:proton glutamate symport protein